MNLRKNQGSVWIESISSKLVSKLGLKDLFFFRFPHGRLEDRRRLPEVDLTVAIEKEEAVNRRRRRGERSGL